MTGRAFRSASTSLLGNGIVPFLAMAGLFVVVSTLTATPIDTGAGYFVLQAFSTYGLLALAIGIAMIAGQFDISTLGMFALGGMVAVVVGEQSPMLGLGAAAGIGALAGVVQGAIVAWLRINSMAVTLGGYLVLVGLCSAIGGDRSVSYADVGFGLRLESPILEIFSIHSLLVVAAFVLVGLVFVFTRVGRTVRAVGGDARSSRVAGVPVDATLVLVFVVVGVLAGLGGALSAYGLATASANPGFSPLIFAATAAIVGGVSFAGGRGTSSGMALGALALSLMQQVFGVLAAPDWVTSVVTGGLLTAAAVAAAPQLVRGIGRWWRPTPSSPAITEPVDDAARLDPPPPESRVASAART